MPSRREFIQAGIAASVAPVAFPLGPPLAGADADAGAWPSHHPLRVVFDLRSRYGAAAAAEAERLGLRVVRTNGDITDFWFNDLAAIWKASPAAIAGFTAHGPLFCLERLGWDHGLRVVFRGVHRNQAGHVVHELTGPLRTVTAAHSVLTGPDWPTHVGRLLNSCAVTPDMASTTVRAAVPSEPSLDTDDALYSWVIAPKHTSSGGQ